MKQSLAFLLRYIINFSLLLALSFSWIYILYFILLRSSRLQFFAYNSLAIGIRMGSMCPRNSLKSKLVWVDASATCDSLALAKDWTAVAFALSVVWSRCSPADTRVRTRSLSRSVCKQIRAICSGREAFVAVNAQEALSTSLDAWRVTNSHRLLTFRCNIMVTCLLTRWFMFVLATRREIACCDFEKF